MQDTLRHEIELMQDRICYALKDPTRIMILYLLHDHPHYVHELVDELGLPQSTISRHLQVLRHRSLVSTTRQGQAIRYALADKRIITSLDLMRDMLRGMLREQSERLAVEVS
ncbi:MAG: ArsR/SmtB family transcription factor [Anaerolineales bacterium]